MLIEDEALVDIYGVGNGESHVKGLREVYEAGVLDGLRAGLKGEAVVPDVPEDMGGVPRETAAAPEKPKFDRAAYMREYARRKRAAAKETAS